MAWNGNTQEHAVPGFTIHSQKFTDSIDVKVLELPSVVGVPAFGKTDTVPENRQEVLRNRQRLFGLECLCPQVLGEMIQDSQDPLVSLFILHHIRMGVRGCVQAAKAHCVGNAIMVRNAQRARCVVPERRTLSGRT